MFKCCVHCRALCVFLGGSCTLRLATRKMGPVITDNGNYILDWNFPKEKYISDDWMSLNTTLIAIPGFVIVLFTFDCLFIGVVETGLFIGVAERAYIGHADGRVDEMHKTKDQ